MEPEKIINELKPNKKDGERKDLEAQYHGTQIAFIAGVSLIIVFLIIDLILYKTFNPVYMCIFTAMETALFTYKYVKLKRKRELISCILYVVSFAAFLTLYVLNLCGVI